MRSQSTLTASYRRPRAGRHTSVVLVITRKPKDGPREWWSLVSTNGKANVWGWLDTPRFAVQWPITPLYEEMATALRDDLAASSLRSAGVPQVRRRRCTWRSR
jgi:hypothetical protein